MSYYNIGMTIESIKAFPVGSNPLPPTGTVSMKINFDGTEEAPTNIVTTRYVSSVTMSFTSAPSNNTVLYLVAKTCSDFFTPTAVLSSVTADGVKKRFKFEIGCAFLNATTIYVLADVVITQTVDVVATVNDEFANNFVYAVPMLTNIDLGDETSLAVPSGQLFKIKHYTVGTRNAVDSVALYHNSALILKMPIPLASANVSYEVDIDTTAGPYIGIIPTNTATVKVQTNTVLLFLKNY